MSRKPLPNPEYYTNAPPHHQSTSSRESPSSPTAPPRRRISQLTVSSSAKTPTISSFSEYSEEETNDILRFYKLDSFDVKSWKVMDYSQTLSSHQQAQVAQKLNEPDDLADFSQDTSTLGALKDPLDIYRNVNPRSKKSNVSFTENEMNINKPEFNSKKFLHLIHSDTPKQELIRGNEKLQHKMKEQSQSLRSLVKSNFDGFVGAKSTVDDVHEEMQEKGMVPDTGYGTDELKQYLDDAINQANSVFGPIIQRTSKAEEIRNIMSHLERHRFYFDLPSILLSNMKQTKYDQIVKDYKKGKQLLKNVQQEDSNQNILYLLMSKIWTKIEVNVEKVQQNLFVKLDDPWMEIESQAKYIELLLQLDSKKDPLLYYIHNQHIWLADYIHRAFSEHTTAVKDIVANSDNDTKSSATDKSFNIIHFMQLLNTYGTDQFLNYLEISQESKIWSSTLEEVKLLLNVVTKTIPELHKFFLLLDRNEIRKQQFPGDMTWVQWHSMNNDVFEMLGLSIDRLFHPDKISQSSAQILGNVALPPLPVESTNSIVIGYYMHLISLELSSAIQETKPITLKNETRNLLYDHLIICRTDLIRMYCKTWLRDIKYLFEIDSEEFGGTGITSELPVDFLYFQNFSLSCLASFYNAVPITLNPNPDEEEEDIFNIIAPTLVNTILTFLAELRTFAFKEVTSSNANQNNNDVNSPMLVVDPEKGIRMLSALNYSVTVEKGLNQIFELFKQKFNFSKVANVSEIKQGFKKLKDELFDNYIRLKFTRIHRILERGIIKSDFKWGNDDVPSEIRPYVYDALMCLVLVHAEITKISHDMLKKIMPHLSDLISVDLLELFGKLKQFGMQGALQATLEIGFIRNTLKPYTSQLSNTNYDKLIHWVQRKQYKSTSPALDSTNPKLQELGKLVAKSEKYTRGMFGCFNAEG